MCVCYWITLCWKKEINTGYRTNVVAVTRRKVCQSSCFYNPQPNSFVTATWNFTTMTLIMFILNVESVAHCKRLEVICRDVIQSHYSQKALIRAAEPQSSRPISEKQLGKCCKIHFSWTVWAALTSSLCLCLPFASQSETWVLVVMSIEVLVKLRGPDHAEGSESDSDYVHLGISLFE